MSTMLHHQAHYREAVERHQSEARAWAHARALSKHAADQKNTSRQVAATEKPPVRRGRLRRLVFHAGHTTALAILIGILL